ncbi:MAG: hypothetical protein QXU18_14195, partial [Thermoplasmatales archaeon]
KAYESDSVSAYGGILAYNGIISSDHVTFLKDKFLEVIIARGYDEDAFEELNKKKNLRLLKGRSEVYKIPDIRSAGNLLLVQEWNTQSHPAIENKCGLTSAKIEDDVRFGWEVVKSIKSNAIAVVRDGWLLASCGGQPNRVDSVKIALDRAKNLGRLSPEDVLISDGFFPFPDSVELIEESGIRNIAAPLGSIRDKEVVDYASRKGLTFMEVKERAFKH